MTERTSRPDAEFDDSAADYDAALNNGLILSGEITDFFARGRIAWLTRCLRALGETPGTVLDFGCGTGSSEPFLPELTGGRSIFGVDVSPRLLEVAHRPAGQNVCNSSCSLTTGSPRTWTWFSPMASSTA